MWKLGNVPGELKNRSKLGKVYLYEIITLQSTLGVACICMFHCGDILITTTGFLQFLSIIS